MAEVGDAAVYGLDVSAQPLGELALRAREPSRDDGLGSDLTEQQLLGLGERALLGAAANPSTLLGRLLAVV